MSKKAALIVGAVLAAATVGAPAYAHHSFPATYHIDQMETVEGEVVQFLFRNPHSFIHVQGKGKDGKVYRYAVEWGGGAALARSGGINARTLRAGDKVIVTGNPGRNDADHRIRLQKIVRPADGWQWGGTFD